MKVVKVLNGKAVSVKRADMIKECLNGRVPVLLVIQFGDEAASNSYIKQKVKCGDYCGIKVIVDKILNYSISETKDAVELIKASIERVKSEVKELNGVIVQLPIPGVKLSMAMKAINDAIDPSLDVDGLTDFNKARFYIGSNEHYFMPCTVKGVLTLLEEYKVKLEGKRVLMIGRSETVGRPLAHILSGSKYNATVTLAHSKSKHLKKLCEEADIIISAVGQPGLVKSCENGATLIDVGISRVNGKLAGDIDITSSSVRLYSYSPVPGGVGPMTVVSLMENVMETMEK